ncbi:hypothetical protein Ancab_005244 [Ancistrocladus abbreviatus]
MMKGINQPSINLLFDTLNFPPYKGTHCAKANQTKSSPNKYGQPHEFVHHEATLVGGASSEYGVYS